METKGTKISANHSRDLSTDLFFFQVDIYSLGLILFELLVPFSTQMERMQTMSEARKLVFPDHFVTSEEHGLVCTMLSPLPTQVWSLSLFKVSCQVLRKT